MQEIVDRLTADDRPAEIARRIVLPYLNHAVSMYASGYATAADIDAAMRFGCGYPVGPLALVDALGAKTVVSDLEDLHASTGDLLHVPAPLLVDLAAREGTLSAAGAGEGAAPALHRAVETVGVVGTGIMAAGIVEVFARAGRTVIVVGRGQDRLDDAIACIARNLDRAVTRGKLESAARFDILARISGATEREALADVDLVVEAIAEDLEIKEQLFDDLDRIVRPGAILATTTSSLSIDALAARTARPGDVVGLHFFNPAPVMRLVEVVSGAATAPEVAETARALCLAVGKHPVSCADRAGFIVNALLFPYLNDAVLLHEAGGGSLAEIDEALKATGLPMGPFELLDVVGNDVSLAIQRTLHVTFGHAGWTPAPLLVELVADGRLGRKVGAGFRTS